MRKFLLVLIALSLIGISPAQATTKAGTKCNKAGTTATSAGKKFTCIRSGGKLVWNKGVTIKKAVALKAGVCPTIAKTDSDPGITQARANTLLTMSEADAEMCAGSLEWIFRVGQRDEEIFAGTFDYRTNRVTIVVLKGTVAQVLLG